MSRTAIFLSNKTQLQLSIQTVDGHIECEQTYTDPGETSMVASIGDPGAGVTANTGNLWINVGDKLVRIEVRKPTKENAEILEAIDYGLKISGTNDYPESGSVYSKSLTIHIAP